MTEMTEIFKTVLILSLIGFGIIGISVLALALVSVFVAVNLAKRYQFEAALKGDNSASFSSSSSQGVSLSRTVI